MDSKIQRLPWIDICRGMGMIFVLLGHTNPPFMKYIYSFHMPLFFILSGYIYKKQENEYMYVCKLFNRYIIPYFILCAINWILHTILQRLGYAGGENFLKYFIGIIYSRGSTNWMPNCSPLWFLTALFCALVIYGKIGRIKNKYLYISLIIGCGVVSALLDLYNFPKLIWNIDTALMAVLFLEIGHQMKQQKVLEKIFVKKKIVIFVFVILLLLGYISVEYNWIKNVSFDNNAYGCVYLMLIGAISLSLICMLICYKNNNSNAVIASLLANIGRHTIFLMGFDYFSNTMATILLSRIYVLNWITIFISKCVILFIGFVIWNFIINKISNERLRKMLIF